MLTKSFFRTAAAVLIIAAAAVVASAQVTTVTGKVTLKQPDGTAMPVEGAQIDIYRTDVKWEAHVKTNKKGEFVHAAVPLVGVYIIAASAPGARPMYFSNLKFSQVPVITFDLEPGDGTRLTLEQLKAGVKSSPAAATGGSTGGGGESAEDKAKREAAEKERARIEEANKKAVETNEALRTAMDAGSKAFNEKRYADAIAAFDQGLAADPTQAVFHLNKSIAMRMVGVDKFNAAVKAKDNAAREAAKAELLASAKTAEEAVKYYREQQSKAAGAPGAAPAQNDMLNYLAARSESYRIALQTNAGAPPEQAVTAIQEYIAAETDPAKKSKAEASLGEALFQSGRVDEAIENYRKILASNPTNIDAMYGLGLALAAKVVDAEKDSALIKEAREMLKQFIDKAPDTHPRKAEAAASVEYLDETMKAASAPKTAPKQDSGGRRGSKRP